MNIFKTLKRGNSREEEYFSAALAILLDEIPELTSYLLAEISGIFDESDEYEIIVEDTFSEGRIDIAIKSLHFEIFIENKISSGLGESQLVRYSNHLESIGKETKLVLLTRDFIDDETIPKYTDKYIFWTDLYTLIDYFRDSITDYVKFEKDEKEYLLRQFLDFLREENMSDEKVSWEYTEGIKSFMNLLNMIQKILNQFERNGQVKKMRKYFANDYAGFTFKRYDEKSNELWIGIIYSDADKLFLEIYGDLREKYDESIFEELNKSPYNPAYIYDFEKNYFLAYSKEKQKEAIYEFIKNSLNNLDELLGQR